MRRVAYLLGLSLAITGCSPKYNVLGIDTDDEEEAEFDYSNATLRIVQPKSGTFVPYNEISNFEAELLDKDGNILELDDVNWSSSVDTAWDPTGRSFDDDSLDVGLHDLTAQIELPNGDRLAYSVGGVLVQSVWAGTYVGTFIADVQYYNTRSSQTFSTHISAQGNHWCATEKSYIYSWCAKFCITCTQSQITSCN